MTLLADDPRALETASQGGAILRWGTAALTVLAAYSTAVWLAVSLPYPEGAQGELQEAVMIELEPLTALEEAPPPAPEPEIVEEVAEVPPTPPEPVAEPLPEPPEPEVIPEPPPPEPTPPPEPVVEEPPPEKVQPEPLPEPPLPEPEPPEPVAEEPPPPVEEPEPLPEPTTQEAVPDLTETNAIAAAVLNPPVPTLRPPPPRPAVVAERKPKVERPKPVRPKVQPATKPERPKKPAVERPARQARSAAPRSDTQAASRSASAPRVSSASWQRQAVSHFRKYRRRLETREKGTARVAVTIDRGGRIVGASLASSSGSSVLDGEALALVRRASPIPAPPEGVGGRTLSLTVPVSM